MLKYVAALLMILTTNAFATSATGEVGKIIVGRLGHQIYIELLNAPQTCGQDHPQDYNYALSVNEYPMGKEILSVLIAAQVANKMVTI